MFAKYRIIEQISNQTNNSQSSQKQVINQSQQDMVSEFKDKKIGHDLEFQEEISNIQVVAEYDDISNQQITEMIPFSQNSLLYQHQFCLDHQMKKIFSQQFQIKLNIYHQDHYQQFEIPEFQTVEQFIQSQQSIAKLFSGQKLIDYIENRPQITQFLQWIYDSSPMLIVKDLLLAACRILYIFSQYQSFQLNRVQLNELVQNVFILNQIYNCSQFRYLRVQINPLYFNGYATNCSPNLLSFILSFTLTILLVSEGEELNPSFQSIVKLKQEIKKSESNGGSFLPINLQK